MECQSGDVRIVSTGSSSTGYVQYCYQECGEPSVMTSGIPSVPALCAGSWDIQDLVSHLIVENITPCSYKLTKFTIFIIILVVVFLKMYTGASPNSTGPVVLTNVNCSGTELGLNSCDYYPSTTGCRSSGDYAGVSCRAECKFGSLSKYI